MRFNPEELVRYERHYLLPEIGLEGQKKLKNASVLCVGLGGLGSPVALYLAAAGVGRLGLVDDDVVEISNLHRQILHSTRDCHESKITSAQSKLRDINPHVHLDLHKVRLNASNALSLVAPYDLIIDGSDNFSTRYLMNDLAFFLKKPLVYGSVFRFEGHCTLFDTVQGGPCYRCIFPEPPAANAIPSCAQAGVLGVLPGIIGTLQATEALKWILKIGDSLRGRLLQVNALTMKFREFHLRRNPHCPLCSASPSITELIDLKESCRLLPSMNNPISPVPSIAVEELEQKLRSGNPLLLIDVREPFEYEICHLQGARLMPLGSLPFELSALERKQEIYIYCRSGGRSAQAVELLGKNGFAKVFNVEGGILAWADRIDPTIQKY
jgi:adenylyltransferase/sulfurtransferase